MSALSVREHLFPDARAATALRTCRVPAAGGPSFARWSVRELVEAERAYVLQPHAIAATFHAHTERRPSMAESLDGSGARQQRSPAGGHQPGRPTFSGSVTSGPHAYQPARTARPSAVRLRLELWVDGEYSHFVCVANHRGGALTLPPGTEPVVFRRRLVLRLYEEQVDLPFPADSSARDLVHEARFDAPAPGSGEVRFVLPGAAYALSYDVARRSRPPLTAEQLVAEFRARSGPGRWQHLSREVVADELAARVREPQLVQQGPASLCGPSAVIHLMARQAPRRYVRAVAQLFDEGVLDTKFGKVTTTASLRAARPPRPEPGSAGIGAADWILGAALRNDENAVFAIESRYALTHQVAGITTVWEVTAWLRELLGHERVRTHAAALLGSLGLNLEPTSGLLGAPGRWLSGFVGWATGVSAKDAMEAGRSAMAEGGCALMMMNTAMFGQKPAGSLFGAILTSVVGTLPSIATHWIVLRPERRVRLTATRAFFGYFTWGSYRDADITRTALEENLFLVVTSREA